MEEKTELDELLGTVGEAMTSPVVVVDERTMASEVARILERAGSSGAPVTRDGRLVGVVTLKDLMSRAGASQAITGPFLRFEHLLAGIEVGKVMTGDVVTAQAEWPLTRAVEAIERTGVNRLPVVEDDGKPVGILTRDDVIRAVALRCRARQGPV